ncbi:von Willebrand factor A domain-containing protein 3A [Geodia barretti]|nr:von Willebrand factor A domain-containing protein 3A [Geodia barretti]
MVAGQWVEGLKGSGVCSLLSGLKRALALTDIDTLLIVLGSKPQEEKHTLVEFLRGRSSRIHVHWVAHLCDSRTREMLSELASEMGAHYHSYSQSRGSDHYSVEDTEIDTVGAELSQAEETISELDLLQSGNISDKVLHILIQLNIACCKFEDESPLCSTEDNPLPVTSREWLEKQSLEASGLNIYHVLAPNAYRQVKTAVTHSPDNLSIVSSVVYDEMMPQFTWHDGTLKYLHVDVHLLENYQVQVEAHISQLRQRLNWLTSGSRVPFGVIAEKSVLVVVELSAATLPFASHLQNCLCLLLLEQVARTEEFNIMRIGDESCSWRPSLTQKSPQSLSDAWVWLLSQSPSGSAASLVPALETALNHGREIGVYLILSSLPREKTETICSFLQEKTSTQQRVNVVFYRHRPRTENHAVAGMSFEEGYYANEQELTHRLQKIATAGHGRFHSFKGPDIVSSDDIEALVKELQKAQDHLRMAENILSDYRSFCKRFVPPPISPSPTLPPSDPPPLYPRPTTAFLCRLNAASRMIRRSASDSHLSRRQHRQRQNNRRTKTCGFYLDKNLEKGFSPERWAPFGAPVRKKPQKAESESTPEWLMKYGLESLGLKFSKFEVSKSHALSHRKTHRHINKNGEIVELYADHQALKKFTQRLMQARESYSQKLREIGKGWRNALGCVSESKVLFLVDISSSMAIGFKDLQAALADFLQNKPHSLKFFNLVAYSSCVKQWQETLAPVHDETMTSAAEWLSQLRPEGSSCLLHALKLSLESGVKNIYLITDGTADHTHNFLLSQVPQLRTWYGDHWKIHTVAFHCSLESSFSFLRDLAHGTGGRYHSYPWGDPDDPSTKLLQNRYLGDDVLKLVQETSSAEDQLYKASQYL